MASLGLTHFVLSVRLSTFHTLNNVLLDACAASKTSLPCLGGDCEYCCVSMGTHMCAIPWFLFFGDKYPQVEVCHLIIFSVTVKGFTYYCFPIVLSSTVLTRPLYNLHLGIE